MPRQRLARPSSTAASAEASAEAAAPESYSGFVKANHFLGAVGTLTCFATVQASQRKWWPASEAMMLHKSVGLCLAGLILVRVPIRLKSTVPPAVAGNVLEQTAAKLSHLALYAFSIVMPVTGVAMGIFGGKGIPFCGLGTVPGLDPKQSGKGWVAGKAFKLHKQAGRYFEYFVPIHIGAVGFHYFAKGQNILKRIF